MSQDYLSQDYLSIIGRSADSSEVQRFFQRFNASWNDVISYEGQGVTEASLELFDSVIELEFIKKLSPKSSVTNQADDFIVSNLSLVNHSTEVNEKIGNVEGTLRLSDTIYKAIEVFGKDYQYLKQKGSYCWRKDDVLIEVGQDRASDKISHITLTADSLDVRSIKEVTESLSSSALPKREDENLGAELPDLPYVDEPVTLGYENDVVVERASGSRFGVVVLIAAVIAALLFYDEIAQFFMQLFK
ncbi:hypothetical protein GCM10009123_03730 [Kangiella japonica]|uniref:Uncharacterized protein n=1 Tax=Kangiella japonica TaxID=647384 RepID=A0ABP3CDL7_9GAMM